MRWIIWITVDYWILRQQSAFVIHATELQILLPKWMQHFYIYLWWNKVGKTFYESAAWLRLGLDLSHLHATPQIYKPSYIMLAFVGICEHLHPPLTTCSSNHSEQHCSSTLENFSKSFLTSHTYLTNDVTNRLSKNKILIRLNLVQNDW